MDSELDFIRPEFLNILFFEQKNLVIFPRVDIKHLHGLEIFTAGYNTIDLESTALHDLKGILEFESSNTYSQNPTLYFITDVEKDKINEIIELDGIHCIINSIENVSEMVNGSSFIFFNKKTNQFLNYDTPDSKLEFERQLISTSANKVALQDKIQKIKIIATRIFTELNQVGNLDNLSQILEEYDPKYWNSILQFTSTYHDVNIQDIPSFKVKSTLPERSRKDMKDYLSEYEIILSPNKAIAKEFIQLLHEYRSKKVNPAHLELEELYNPKMLYNYLQNRHWKDGIPRAFIQDWIHMNISTYKLTESDELDFKNIFRQLKINQSKLSYQVKEIPARARVRDSQPVQVHSPRDELRQQDQWMLDCLEKLEEFVDSDLIDSFSLEDKSYLLEKLSEISNLIGTDSKSSSKGPKIVERSQILSTRIKNIITSSMMQVNLENWIELHCFKDTYKFTVQFITRLDEFHVGLFGKFKKEMPIKIKELQFPPNLEKMLISFNKFRNKISHEGMKVTQLNSELARNEKRLKEIYFHLLAYLIKSQVKSIVDNYGFSESHDAKKSLYKFIIKTYFKDDTFSTQEIKHVFQINQFT